MLKRHSAQSLSASAESVLSQEAANAFRAERDREVEA